VQPGSPHRRNRAGCPPGFPQLCTSYAMVGQVLRAPLDFTTKDWLVRNFYDPPAVVAYARWSQPDGQPHRDASDTLAELSDPAVLAVPADGALALRQSSQASSCTFAPQDSGTSAVQLCQFFRFSQFV